MVDPDRAQHFVYMSYSLVLCVLLSLEGSSPLVIPSVTQSLARLEQSLLPSIKNNFNQQGTCRCMSPLRFSFANQALDKLVLFRVFVFSEHNLWQSTGSQDHW